MGFSLPVGVLWGCENLAPFLKPETKTPKLVSSDFGFGLEIKLVACLK